MNLLKSELKTFLNQFNQLSLFGLQSEAIFIITIVF